MEGTCEVGFMSENQTPQLKPLRLYIFIKVKILENRTNVTSAVSLVTVRSRDGSQSVAS